MTSAKLDLMDSLIANFAVATKKDQETSLVMTILANVLAKPTSLETSVNFAHLERMDFQLAKLVNVIAKDLEMNFVTFLLVPAFAMTTSLVMHVTLVLLDFSISLLVKTANAMLKVLLALLVMLKANVLANPILLETSVTNARLNITALTPIVHLVNAMSTDLLTIIATRKEIVLAKIMPWEKNVTKLNQDIMIWMTSNLVNVMLKVLKELNVTIKGFANAVVTSKVKNVINAWQNTGDFHFAKVISKH